MLNQVRYDREHYRETRDDSSKEGWDAMLRRGDGY